MAERDMNAANPPRNGDEAVTMGEWGMGGNRRSGIGRLIALQAAGSGSSHVPVKRHS
jgi:hypothetical protein